MNALRTILPALFLSLGCIAAPATLFHDDFSRIHRRPSVRLEEI